MICFYFILSGKRLKARQKEKAMDFTLNITPGYLNVGYPGVKPVYITNELENDSMQITES